MNNDTRPTGVPVVHALRIEAEALKRAAQMVEDADLIPRGELVAWLEREVLACEQGEYEAKVRGEAQNAYGWGALAHCHGGLARRIRDGNPWEQQ